MVQAISKRKSCLDHFSFLKFALFAAVAAAVVYYIVKCQTTFFFHCGRKIERVLFKALCSLLEISRNDVVKYDTNFTLISFLCEFFVTHIASVKRCVILIVECNVENFKYYVLYLYWCTKYRCKLTKW